MATERVAVSEIESIIRQLRNVIGARVVNDASGMIQEIHILSDGTRPPKQVVRDVESALQARLGIALDHKKVSVAQVQSVGGQEASARIQFANVSIAISGQTAEASVQLTRDEAVYNGTAEGSSSTAGQARAVATATAKALQGCLNFQPIMLVEDAAVQTVGGHQVVTVVMTLSGNRSDEVLCGSCVVRQDLLKSTVFATLDAVNRRLARS